MHVSAAFALMTTMGSAHTETICIPNRTICRRVSSTFNFLINGQTGGENSHLGGLWQRLWLELTTNLTRFVLGAVYIDVEITGLEASELFVSEF